jgi:acyl-CoA thioester hydrolase
LPAVGRFQVSGFMFTTEHKLRVRYAETDQMDVVYHGNYPQYFETARAEGIRALGLTYKELEASGVIMPVVELHMKYVRPAHYDDLITIKTELRELPNDHRIEFHHEVFNESGKLLTIGRIVLYFVDATTREKCVMPELLREKLNPFFESGS